MCDPIVSCSSLMNEGVSVPGLRISSLSLIFMGIKLTVENKGNIYIFTTA